MTRDVIIFTSELALYYKMEKKQNFSHMSIAYAGASFSKGE
jgi:hypothetical protein